MFVASEQRTPDEASKAESAPERPVTPLTAPQAALFLQGQAGNQAVTALLDGRPAQSPRYSPTPSASGDPKLDRALATCARTRSSGIMREEEPEQESDLIPDWLKEGIQSAASAIPGYTLLAAIVGKDPITEQAVRVSREELVEQLLGSGPFAAAAGPALSAVNVLDDIFTIVTEGLAANDLTLARVERDIGAAWDEVSVLEGIDGNVAIIERYVDALLADVVRFVDSIAERVIELVRAAAADAAEPLLATPEIEPIWNLAKKVLHYDPLRGETVDAPTVEILEDFLRLIGEEERLAQLQQEGALQDAADWLDAQAETFSGLLGQLLALFTNAWEAIQPANLPDLLDNLTALAGDAFTLVRGIGDFATTVIVKALELVKTALLGWLSQYAYDIPGFRLLTVVIGQNPFTGDAVERSAENLIGGFIALLPGGEQTYQQLAESGVIGQAGQRIEAEMGRLGISLEMITGTFAEIWDSLTLDDLLDPITAFERIADRFGDPISRLFEFVGTVIEVVVELILRLMNFPSDLLGRIVANLTQSIADIQRDPVGFLVNLLAALKAGFGAFFDNAWRHLTQGLADWLFRGLGKLGIQVPSDLSPESVLDLILQVLGVTAERLWEKLSNQLGPERVAMLRNGLDRVTGIWAFVKDVEERGLAAIWEHVSDQLGALWDSLVGMAQEWLMSTIVERVTVKLLSMLDPTGIMAIVNSMVAFFNAIQSAIEYLRDILEIVDDYVTSFAEVAAGNIGAGAGKIERGLANAIPVAIGFMASQVGIGDVPEKIVELIERLRALVDEALDWLVERAVSLGQSALGAITGDGDEEEAPPAEDAAAGQAIPEGLPPDEIKRLTLDQAEARLTSGQFTSVESVHEAVDAIADANRTSGLSRLKISIPDPDSMELLVEAAASPPEGRRIKWEDIIAPGEHDDDAELERVRKSLGRATQASYAAVAVNGRQIGSLSSSGGGVHAEERIVCGPDWTEAIKAAREAPGASRVTVMINRTPCSACVEFLKTAIENAREELGPDAPVTFVLAATGTYRRQGRLKAADRQKIEDALAHLKEHDDAIYQARLLEEIEFWKEDLRSDSTEWEDSDEEFSGLGDLDAAGWEIMGLDVGQKLTPRQIEMGQIAARLAGDVEHNVVVAST
jgi:hypothetical protein